VILEVPSKSEFDTSHHFVQFAFVNTFSSFPFFQIFLNVITQRIAYINASLHHQCIQRKNNNIYNWTYPWANKDKWRLTSYSALKKYIKNHLFWFLITFSCWVELLTFLIYCISAVKILALMTKHSFSISTVTNFDDQLYLVFVYWNDTRKQFLERVVVTISFSLLFNLLVINARQCYVDLLRTAEKNNLFGRIALRSNLMLIFLQFVSTGVSHADDVSYVVDLIGFNMLETPSDRAVVGLLNKIVANFMQCGYNFIRK
jgi:hypothetical protein